MNKFLFAIICVSLNLFKYSPYGNCAVHCSREVSIYAA